MTVSDWSVPAAVRDSLCPSWRPVSVCWAQRWFGRCECKLQSSAKCLSPLTDGPGVRQRSRSRCEGGRGHWERGWGLTCPPPAALICETKYKKFALLSETYSLKTDFFFFYYYFFHRLIDQLTNRFSCKQYGKTWSDIINIIITCWARSWCHPALVCPAGPSPSALLLGNVAAWPQAPPAASSDASWRFPVPAASTHISSRFYDQTE